MASQSPDGEGKIGQWIDILPMEEIDKFVLGAAPPGVVANLEHPTWHGQSLVIVCSICIFVMLFMTSVRMYDRSYMMRKWTLDDSTFVVSLLFGIAMNVMILVVISGGVHGYRAWELTVGDLTKAVLVHSFAVLTLTGPISYLVKLSLFSLIYHAFHPLTYIRRMVYIGLITTGLYHLAAAVAIGVMCRPHDGTDRRAYLIGSERPQCHGLNAPVQRLVMASSFVNLFADLWLLIIPLPAVYKLRMPRKRKIGLGFIFLSGIGGCVMSVLNIVYRRSGFVDPARDTFYTTVSIGTVLVIETAVGISIPCMASGAKVISRFSSALRPYFHTDCERVPSEKELKVIGKEPSWPKPVVVKHTEEDMDTIDQWLEQVKTTRSRADTDRVDSRIDDRSRV